MSASIRSLDGYENGNGVVLMAFGGRVLRKLKGPRKPQCKEQSTTGSENRVDNDEPGYEHNLAIELTSSGDRSGLAFSRAPLYSSVPGLPANDNSKPMMNVIRRNLTLSSRCGALGLRLGHWN